MKGMIFDVKEMSLHDGPGIRTTVFFKGCPLRCLWCHNPEGLSRGVELSYNKARCRGCGCCQAGCLHPECAPFGKCMLVCPENCLQTVGREVEASVLARELLTGAELLGHTFGGFTFSGGEPLFQTEFLLALAKELRGYHLCVETSGFAAREDFLSAIEATDYVIMDIKLIDPTLHKAYTGRENGRILENYAILRESGKPYLIRTPLIPDMTDTEENLAAIKELIGDDPWEKLPYNSLAGAKYQMLGKTYQM